MYDMGNRDFVIKRNKVNTSAAVDIFFVALLYLRGLNIHDKQSKNCFYIYGLLTKLVRSRWLDISQVLFLRVWSRSINRQKKNEANMQSS